MDKYKKRRNTELPKLCSVLAYTRNMKTDLDVYGRRMDELLKRFIQYNY